MQHLYEPAVGDIVIVEREDRREDRVPRAYRSYVTYRTYLFRAQVVRVCPDRQYHRVLPLPWSDDDPVVSRHSRKAYRTKIFTVSH